MQSHADFLAGLSAGDSVCLRDTMWDDRMLAHVIESHPDYVTVAIQGRRWFEDGIYRFDRQLGETIGNRFQLLHPRMVDALTVAQMQRQNSNYEGLLRIPSDALFTMERVRVRECHSHHRGPVGEIFDAGAHVVRSDDRAVRSAYSTLCAGGNVSRIVLVRFEGRNIIDDGHHRVQAALEAGVEELDALVFDRHSYAPTAILRPGFKLNRARPAPERGMDL